MPFRIEGGTEHPRFYRISNKAALAALNKELEEKKHLQTCADEFAAKWRGKPQFLEGSTSAFFAGLRLEKPQLRDDAEIWTQPDRKYMTSRPRKRPIKSWSDEMKALHAEAIAEYDALVKASQVEVGLFIAAAGFDPDCRILLGHNMGFVCGADSFLFAIKAKPVKELEGVEAISVDDYEAGMAKLGEPS